MSRRAQPGRDGSAAGGSRFCGHLDRRRRQRSRRPGVDRPRRQGRRQHRSGPGQRDLQRGPADHFRGDDGGRSGWQPMVRRSAAGARHGRQRRRAAIGTDRQLRGQLPGDVGRRACGVRIVVVSADDTGHRHTRPGGAGLGHHDRRCPGLAVRPRCGGTGRRRGSVGCAAQSPDGPHRHRDNRPRRPWHDGFDFTGLVYATRNCKGAAGWQTRRIDRTTRPTPRTNHPPADPHRRRQCRPPTDTAPPNEPADTPAPAARAPDKPAKKAPGKKEAAKAAKKAEPAKAAKKAAAKQAPAKKAPAKQAPAKKAPAKKAPAKKATAERTKPGAANPPSQAPGPSRTDTNGQLAAAAKDVAAQAKSTVEAARNPLPAEPGPASAGRSPVPLAVALAISLLALLLVRQLRRGASDDD